MRRRSSRREGLPCELKWSRKGRRWEVGCWTSGDGRGERALQGEGGGCEPKLKRMKSGEPSLKRLRKRRSCKRPRASGLQLSPFNLYLVSVNLAQSLLRPNSSPNKVARRQVLDLCSR